MNEQLNCTRGNAVVFLSQLVGVLYGNRHNCAARPKGDLQAAGTKGSHLGRPTAGAFRKYHHRMPGLQVLYRLFQLLYRFTGALAVDKHTVHCAHPSANDGKQGEFFFRDKPDIAGYYGHYEGDVIGALMVGDKTVVATFWQIVDAVDNYFRRCDAQYKTRPAGGCPQNVRIFDLV